jgi:hypothetical protein
MASFGPRTIGGTGRMIMVLANLNNASWKVGGITIDWDTVTAAGADGTLADGTPYKAGDKYIEFGTVMNKITASGKYGPAATNVGGATAATDGRQTTAKGTSFVLNESVLMSERASDHPGVFDGGRINKARLKVGGNGQPTLADFNAAFPNVTFADA